MTDDVVMGKASRLKEQRRRERAERERAIRADPVLALATTLVTRGWEDLGREPIMCPQGWWEFPPSLRRDEGQVRQIIHPATIVLDDPSITVEFAGRDNNACAAHQSPAARTFPLNHEGVAALVAALDEVEGHVVDGVEMLACADGRGGCGKDDPVLALRAALLERGWKEHLDNDTVLWFEFPRTRVDMAGLDEEERDVVWL